MQILDHETDTGDKCLKSWAFCYLTGLSSALRSHSVHVELNWYFIHAAIGVMLFYNSSL